MRFAITLAALSAFSLPAMAQAVPEGLCEIMPARGGHHLEIAQAFLPPASAGVTVNAMAIDCETLDAAETGDLARPRTLFMNVRDSSPGTLPAELPAALDAFERRFADEDMLGRDDHGVYIAQRGDMLSGVSAYTSIDGTAHIFSLIEYQQQDAVERAWPILAAYAAARAR